MDRVTTPPLQKLTLRRFSWASAVLVLALLRTFCEVTEAEGGACPSDVTMAAHACFTEFSREYKNVKNSPKRLCCGLDVETLRAFCSSYTRAEGCIQQLLAQCEDPTAVERALTNLRGTQTALHDMCRDDSIIERYARHQSCITKAGPVTLHCIQRHLNDSESIRLMANIPRDQPAEFCRAVIGMEGCTQRNVGRQCGRDASSLMPALLRPMVRYSSECSWFKPRTRPTSSPTSSWEHPITEQTQQASSLSSSSLSSSLPSSVDWSQHGRHQIYDVTTVSGSAPLDVRLWCVAICLNWILLDTFLAAMA